jgi:hypothetical protein
MIETIYHFLRRLQTEWYQTRSNQVEEATLKRDRQQAKDKRAEEMPAAADLPDKSF